MSPVWRSWVSSGSLRRPRRVSISYGGCVGRKENGLGGNMKTTEAEGTKPALGG